MSGRATNLIDIDKTSTLSSVLNELQRLDTQLVDLELTQFKLFNRAYYQVTYSVEQAIQNDFFKNPAFIEKFILSFAAYYFEAINNTLSDSPDLTLPWAKLNEYAKLDSPPRFLALMLGANAHINNDLPQVIETLMKTENTKELLSDVVKIDKLLMESGRQIIGEFDEDNKLLDFLKRRFQFMYYRPAMYTILYWRVRAWRNFRKLRNGTTQISDITNRSVKIADRILKLGEFLE